MHLIVSSNFNKWYAARQNNGFLGRENWPLLRQVGRYAVWMWIAAGSKPNCWKPFKRPRSSYDDDGVGSGWKYHSRSRFILSESIFTSEGEWVEWVRSDGLLNCWVYFFSLHEVLSMCEEVPWLNKWLAGIESFPKTFFLVNMQLFNENISVQPATMLLGVKVFSVIERWVKFCRTAALVHISHWVMRGGFGCLLLRYTLMGKTLPLAGE